jgi:hypothetical protein
MSDSFHIHSPFALFLDLKGTIIIDMPQIFVPQVKLGFSHFFLNSAAPLVLEDDILKNYVA